MSPARRHLVIPLAAAALGLSAAAPARAQLAGSFYNVTAIQTRRLPNAIQVIVRTDGTVAFGGDRDDFMSLEPDTWEARPVTSFRLRLVNARSSLPAFVDLGAYPVDSAAVTLGTEAMTNPYFGWGQNAWIQPRVDIRLRFYVPVRVQRFIVDRRSWDSSYNAERGLFFSEFLGPRDVEVRMGDDRRSIVITVITDRADAGKAANIRRSPVALQSHHAEVAPVGGGAFRVDALHEPLADLLAAFSRAADLPLTARTDAMGVDVSMHLPTVTTAQFLRALAVGYGLNVKPRPPEEGGGYSVGRDGQASTEETLPLHNLSPESARLLFPDFLLPSLRADGEHNALIASGTPELIARLKRDLIRLDRPQAQVKVEASVWEFATADEARQALALSGTIGSQTVSADPQTGQVSLVVGATEANAFTAAAQALEQRQRVRLAARPSISVLSGQTGTLFVGQTRYLTVLRAVDEEQRAEALKLQIGSTLTVTPTVGAADDITLELHPRVSTVDSVEERTGLPTLGIREMNTVVRVHAGETIVVGGLQSTDTFTDDRRPPLPVGALVRAHARDHSRTYLVMLVTAHRE